MLLVGNGLVFGRFLRGRYLVGILWLFLVGVGFGLLVLRVLISCTECVVALGLFEFVVVLVALISGHECCGCLDFNLLFGVFYLCLF